MSPNAKVALIVSGAVTAVLVLIVVAVSLVDSTPPTEAPGATRQTIRLTVDTHPSDSGLKALFEDARRDHTAPGGYYVEINCRTGGTATVDNRLANGRFAVGQAGANLTGLPAGGSEFSTNPGRACPA